MRFFLISIIFISNSIQILAQKNEKIEKTKSFFLSYGVAYHIKIDKTYSRLVKKGFNNSFSFRFDNNSNNTMFSLQGGFIQGKLKTKGNNINIIDNYGGNFTLRYLKKNKKISKDKLLLFIGLNVGFRGDVWFPKNAVLRYGWDIYLGTGVATSLLYKINSKLTLQYNFDAPLIGILWRSHNNGQQLITEEIQSKKGIVSSAFETPRFSTVFNTLYLDNSFQLFYSISKKLAIFYNLRISYIHIKKPLIKKGYELENAFGLHYKF